MGKKNKKRLKYIELRFSIGKVKEGIEIKEFIMESLNGKMLSPVQNKGDKQIKKLSFRLQPGVFRCEIKSRIKGRDQTLRPELILPKDQPPHWKNLPEIFDRCYEFLYHF
jgi:hypothetical protein